MDSLEQVADDSQKAKFLASDICQEYLRLARNNAVATFSLVILRERGGNNALERLFHVEAQSALLRDSLLIPIFPTSTRALKFHD